MTASPAVSTGGPLGPGNFCAACGAGLATGAQFCHRCGTPAGEGVPVARAAAAAPASSGGLAGVLPWGVAFVALMALVAMVAGRNFGAAKGSQVDGSSNAVATPTIDGPGRGAGAPGSGQRAPDISNMSPEERADRLYERIMTYAENGKPDSAAMFAVMALPAHELLENIDNDRRYHAGRIAEVAGLADIAQAQSDTILRKDANHLLGIVLGIRAARLARNEAEAKAYEQRLVRAFDTERARQLPEYDQHRAEIEQALSRARGAA